MEYKNKNRSTVKEPQKPF